MFSLKRLNKLYHSASLLNRFISFEVKGSMVSLGPVLGATAYITHTFDQNSVNTFSQICGDNNPIHLNEEYAKKTMFGKPIIHGMLASSLFSTIFGRTIHSSVYINQTLTFRAPIYVNTPVNAQIEIIKIDKKSRGYFIKCTTKCYISNNDVNSNDINSKEVVAIDGEATVLIPLEKYDALIKSHT